MSALPMARRLGRAAVEACKDSNGCAYHLAEVTEALTYLLDTLDAEAALTVPPQPAGVDRAAWTSGQPFGSESSPGATS